jgi:hypothetical protein
MMRYISALIAQGFSYYTTLGFVALLTQPGGDPQRWAITAGLALLAEAMLFGMKEEMWRPGIEHKVVGALGFVGDGFVNAGGLGAIALAVLTFGPGAFLLGRLEVDLRSPDALLWSTMAVALGLGLALSVAPHIMWRGTRARPAARAA